MRPSVASLVLLRNLLLFDQAVEVLFDGLQGALQCGRLDIDERDFKSGLSKHMRNAIAHGSSSDDGNVLHTEGLFFGLARRRLLRGTLFRCRFGSRSFLRCSLLRWRFLRRSLLCGCFFRFGSGLSSF